MELEVFEHSEKHQMPWTVLRAVELLYFNAIFAIVFLLFNFDQIVEQGDFAVQFISILLAAFLAYRIEHRSKFFRFLLVLTLLHGLPNMAMHAMNIFETHIWVATFYVGQMSLQALALFLLLTPSASRWYRGKASSHLLRKFRDS